MAKSNPRKHALAQERVRDGRWVVDPDAGTVWSAYTQQLLRPTVKRGYCWLYVRDSESGKDYQVHLSRVVWESVHGPIEDPELEVNHMDGDKGNNSIHNLELTTGAGNMRHAYRTGLRQPLKGERHWCARLTDEKVLEIRALITQGMSERAIARKYGVDRQIISRIRRGVLWKHVPQAVGG